MEDFWCQVEFGYLRCGYFNSGGVRSLRKFCLDLETGSGLGVAYQVNHGLVADQRSCPPILRDEREHPVFDLVPLKHQVQAPVQMVANRSLALHPSAL